jgi:hypothetical protein
MKILAATCACGKPMHLVSRCCQAEVRMVAEPGEVCIKCALCGADTELVDAQDPLWDRPCPGTIGPHRHYPATGNA